MKQLCLALGLPETATEAEALTALNKLLATNAATLPLVALTGKADAGAALGVMTAWKAAHEQVATLTAKVTELEGAAAKSKVDALITAGKAAGKIPPALEATLGKMDAETLSAYLEAAPVLVTPGKEQANAGGTPPTAASLTADQLAVCKQIGVTPDQFAAQLALQSAK